METVYGDRHRIYCLVDVNGDLLHVELVKYGLVRLRKTKSAPRGLHLYFPDNDKRSLGEKERFAKENKLGGWGFDT